MSTEEALVSLQRPTITDETKEALRQAAFGQSFEYSNKQRFGLFSSAVSIAIGETNKYPRKKANRDPEDGKPIIGPRNFYTRPIVKGKDDRIYFSRQSYISVDDPYQQLKNVGLRSILDGEVRKAKGGHDANFRPAKNIKEKLYQTRYENIPLKENNKVKNFKDEEGNIIIGPRNFTTMPIKRGKVGKNTSFAGPVPYIADPYDNKKVIAQKELKYHQSKVQDKPFSQQARRPPYQFGTFNRPSTVVGDPSFIAPRKKAQVQSERVLPDLPGKEPLHDKAFKPFGNKGFKGLHPFIGSLPEFMADPPKELKRKVIVEGQDAEERPGFKLSYNYRSRPQPSIATNVRNLKSQFPRAYSTNF